MIQRLLRSARGHAALPPGLFLLAGGMASVAAGTDANWDLRNYHLFAAHAFLHGLTFHHLAPAQMQSFFNPLPHLPGYGLFVLLQDAPRVYAFLMGLPAGLCGWLLLRIARLHLGAAGVTGATAVLASGLTVLVGVTGAAFAPAIGTSTGDMLVAVPVLAGYLLVLRASLPGGGSVETGFGPLLLAGFLAGLGAGLKLTMAIYAAPLGLMILLLLGPRAALAAAFGMAAGFALGWAPFAAVLWRETGNPFFPMFNHLFRSSEFLPVALADERFLPRSLLQAVTYPFWWTSRSSGLVTELPMRDPRVALGYAGTVALLLGTAWHRRTVRSDWLLLGVVILSFALWCRLFGIYRYLLVLEMLAPVVVMLALARLWPRALLPGLGIAAALCLATTIRPDWGHVRTGAQVISVDPMPVAGGDLVLLVDDEPQSYLVPFMAPGARVVGIGTNLVRPEHDHGLNRRIRAAIAGHAGQAWAVTVAGTTDAKRDALLAAYGLRVGGACLLVRTSMERGGHRFCPVLAGG